MLFATVANGQTTTDDQQTEKVWRVNFLNPAVELELPIGKNTTFSSALGVGYGGSYPDLTSSGTGFIYIIAPFSDLQFKRFYSLERRKGKGKTIAHNTGSFISFRVLARGNSIAENRIRTSEFDMAFGPTWGIQRKLGKRFHFLCDVGPIYYTDFQGNGNFLPMLQVNLGIDLSN